MKMIHFAVICLSAIFLSVYSEEKLPEKPDFEIKVQEKNIFANNDVKVYLFAMKKDGQELPRIIKEGFSLELGAIDNNKNLKMEVTVNISEKFDWIETKEKGLYSMQMAIIKVNFEGKWAVASKFDCLDNQIKKKAKKMEVVFEAK